MKKYCKHCDKTYSANMKFCETCGRKLIDLIPIEHVKSEHKVSSQHKSKLNMKYVGIGIAGIVIILLIGFMINWWASGYARTSTGVGTTVSGTVPTSATVTGIISASGSGTYVTGVTITSNSGQSYTPNFQSASGYYSITLPNQNTYTVSAQWTGQYSWQTGTCQLGSFSLNIGVGGSTTQQQNFNCQTPNSLVTLSGTVQTVGSGTSPTKITFASMNQPTYTATPVNGAYNIALANQATYSVVIYWTGYFGATGQCNPQTLTVNQGVGISSQTQNWSC